LEQDSKSPNVTTSQNNQRVNNDSTKDGVAYACLLKNELLGAGIEDVKNQQADSCVNGQRMALVPKEAKNVFQVNRVYILVYIYIER